MPDETPQLTIAVKRAIAEVKRVGDDPFRLPEVLRVILLVHTAQGIIDNGGFQYFFESDFDNKPPYPVFVDAFKIIGANDEAQIIEQAFNLFPFPDPHLSSDARNQFMDSFRDDDKSDEKSPFTPLTNKLCGNKNVWRCLNDYVIKNASSIPV